MCPYRCITAARCTHYYILLTVPPPVIYHSVTKLYTCIQCITPPPPVIPGSTTTANTPPPRDIDSTGNPRNLSGFNLGQRDGGAYIYTVTLCTVSAARRVSFPRSSPPMISRNAFIIIIIVYCSGTSPSRTTGPGCITFYRVVFIGRVVCREPSSQYLLSLVEDPDQETRGWLRIVEFRFASQVLQCIY